MPTSVTLNVSLVSTSVSLARIWDASKVSAKSSSTLKPLSSTATGPSLVPLIVTVATAVSVPPWLSEIVYVISTVVLSPTANESKSVPGLKATVPSALTETLPWPASTWASVTLNVSDVSGSVSLERTLMSIAAFSSVVAVSATAVGPSFSPRMVIVTVSDASPPAPSETVYVNVCVSVSPTARWL